MDKKTKIYIGIILSFMFIGVFFQMLKPKEINWLPTYYGTHKSPYGTYVLKNSLKELFPETNISEIHKPTYEFLKENPENGTLIYIDHQLNFDEAEFYDLLEFIEKGNDVFISTSAVRIDTLNLITKEFETSGFDLIPFFTVINPNLTQKEYSFDREFSKNYFSKIDTTNSIALGKSGLLNAENERESEGINFIKHPYGKGNLYLHTFPEAFTNYYLLKDENSEYSASVLSYLGNPERIYWDEYFKTGKPTNRSLMQHVLLNKSLKWGYYIALIGVLFFIIFKGKREQRVVPIIEPLKNNTLAFVQTIAGMYFNNKSHKSISDQKIIYFLEQIRIHYHLDTSNINEEFIKNFTEKSGSDYEEVKQFFTYLENIYNEKTIQENQLIKLNKFLEKFQIKNKNGRK
ncbi:DUF4350 domain-containing protein [Aureivirga marina]|uniref:DUF4350 domain-containing protein n=1 Tax=Aureivirga marina TaxID=1182451 RepID=UPI0018CBCA39|nr:DUF4350 domain-containing protein [Aureivirga marina]